MKDRQVEMVNAQPRVFILSAVLHCVSMTAIVFLRSGFGYAFLRPKSVFIAFSWAFLLFSVYSWLESGMWPKNAALCLFGLGAVILYAFHLGAAFVSQLRGTATHDNHAGTPHIIRILGAAGITVPQHFQTNWMLWAEPVLVLLVALLARWPLGATNLSTWLLLVSVALWCKEALNFWFQLRQRKRQRDAFEDAEEGIDTHRPEQFVIGESSRKDKVRRQRAG